jgi:outer membrane protein OmpA-like peptidoglycan-associated protein
MHSRDSTSTTTRRPAPEASNRSHAEAVRETSSPTTTHHLMPREGESCSEEVERAKQLFLRRFLYGPQDLVAPTNIGGFSAMFLPLNGSGQMYVYVGSAVQFQDSLSISRAGVVTDNTGELGDLVTALNAPTVPVPRRRRAVALFQWNATDRATSLANIRSRVQEAQAAWNGQYSFYVDRECWEDIEASVRVTLGVREGSRGSGDHLQITINKVPPTGGFSAGAWVSTNTVSDARDSDMVLDSNDITQRPDSSGWLNWSVSFENNSARLTREARTRLRNFVMFFQDSDSNDVTTPIRLVGRASSTGDPDHNEALAQRRVNAVQSFIQRNFRGPRSRLRFTGITEDRISTENAGSTGATEDASWRRVDLIVGDGHAQNTVVHEFGHVFGLDDEYVSDSREDILDGGTGGQLGNASAHDTLSQGIGAGEATYENNDSIMSVGNEVRPQHYATFGWALKTLTGINDWKIRS